MICSELERAFKQCKNRDDAFKLGLVYFDEVILIGAKNNFVVNLDYLNLVEYMDRFNSFAWGSISFEQLHDSLSFAASRRGRGKVEGDDEGDEEEEKEVGGTKRAQLSIWGCKGFSHFSETVDLASPSDVCAKVGGLVGELATDEYEDVKGLDDDNIIVSMDFDDLPDGDEMHSCDDVNEAKNRKGKRSNNGGL
ncbi:hypothetical protein DVH24_016296 [Malus domestica]|uniref:DUF1985 domain-containing protein n=1 Tax=Malus domestica TaxID=3750 RepID=A0A498HT87_MALDO|nr:hypothetical protein DVH24_016296 [Malus domestica]